MVGKKTIHSGKKERGKAKPPQSVSGRIAIEAQESPVYYVNYLEVSQSPYDFTLTGVKVPSRLTELQMHTMKEKGVVSFPPSVQLIFPTKIIKGLVRALQTQIENYEQIHGNLPEE